MADLGQPLKDLQISCAEVHGFDIPNSSTPSAPMPSLLVEIGLRTDTKKNMSCEAN